MDNTSTSLDEYVCLAGMGKAIALDISNRTLLKESKVGSGFKQLWLHTFGSHIIIAKLKDDVLYAGKISNLSLFIKYSD